jgi:hypothetical protein
MMADEYEHEVPVQVLNIILGATDDEESAEFAFGGEYEYRFSGLFGVGIIAEHAPDGHHGEGATVALGAVHPRLSGISGQLLGPACRPSTATRQRWMTPRGRANRGG